MVRNDVMGLSAALALVVVGVATSVAQAQDCDGWVALHEIMTRRNPLMVDAGDGSVLLFGGSLGGQIPTQDINTATNETWRFDGKTWQFVTTSGPSPRVGTAGAFDAARSTFVLFGGGGLNPVNGFSSLFNDTWEFVQGEWTLRNTAHAPSARYGHAMAFDQSRNATFLYGGVNALTQFWSYDGADWTEIPLTTPNPGGQSNHKLVVDPRDNSIVLIPFTTGSPCWKWDGTTWSQLSAPQIQPSSAFFDPSRNTIVLVSNQGLFYTYTGQGPAVLVPGITPPGGAGQIYPTVMPRASGEWIAIIGPSTNPTVPFPASYKVSATGWSPIATRPQPNATHDVAFGYHTPTSEFVLFGGTRALSSPQLAETWILRGETWREHTGTEPTARIGAYIAYSPHRDASLLLGGNVSGTTLWSWNGSNWSSAPTGGVPFTPGTPPDYDTQRDAILWPTIESVTRIDETVVTTAATGISTQNGAAAYDPIRETLIFAGGQNSSGTYRLVDAPTGTGFLWQSLSLNNIIGRWGPRMAYDPDRAGLVLFGGFSSGSTGVDVSAFPRKTYFLASSATAWTTLPLSFNGPIGRKFQGMGYDPVARRVVMYGGLTHGSTAPLQETWKLARGPAAVALEPSETYVVPGETAEVFIIASGGGVIDYQWFKDGEPVANSARITGADSDTLQIQSFTSDDNGEYHVTVGNPCGQDQSVIVQVRAIPACPGDFNDSGGVDATDLADFFDAYERGLMLADVDLSGGVDAGDIAVFIGSFEAGGC